MKDKPCLALFSEIGYGGGMNTAWGRETSLALLSLLKGMGYFFRMDLTLESVVRKGVLEEGRLIIADNSKNVYEYDN